MEHRQAPERVVVAAGFVVFIMLTAGATPLSGQTDASPPRIEFGGHISSFGFGVSTAAGPRVTVNLTHVTAIDVSVEWAIRAPGFGSEHDSLTLAQLRQTLHRFRGGSLAVSAGAGVWSWDKHFPAAPLFDRAEFSSRGSATAVVAGGSLDRQVAQHLAIRAEGQIVFTKGDVNLDLHLQGTRVLIRGMIGVSLPIGAYAPLPPARPLPPPPPAAPPPVATVPVSVPNSVAGLHEGQKVWVTMADGRELSGIADSDTSITVEASGSTMSGAIADVRKIEAPDSIADGVVKGSLVGFAAGMATGYTAINFYGGCGGSCDHTPVLILTSIGTGIGALVGGLIDSGHEGRRVLYVSTRKAPIVSVMPLLSAHGAGVGGFVRW